MCETGIGLRNIYEGDQDFLILAGLVVEEVVRRRAEARSANV